MTEKVNKSRPRIQPTFKFEAAVLRKRLIEAAASIPENTASEFIGCIVAFVYMSIRSIFFIVFGRDSSAVVFSWRVSTLVKLSSVLG